MSDAPYFHDASRTVRFWVDMGDRSFVGASIGQDALRHHFSTPENADPLATFSQNTKAIETAVRARVAQGALEPVMLREHDMRAVPT